MPAVLAPHTDTCPRCNGGWVTLAGGTTQVRHHRPGCDRSVDHDEHAVDALVASLDDDLTVRENLVRLGLLTGLHRTEARGRAHAALAACRLTSFAFADTRTVSPVARRRLVAAWLCPTPSTVTEAPR